MGELKGLSLHIYAFWHWTVIYKHAAFISSALNSSFTIVNQHTWDQIHKRALKKNTLLFFTYTHKNNSKNKLHSWK